MRLKSYFAVTIRYLTVKQGSFNIGSMFSVLYMFLQVITREAIYYGLVDSTYQASLVDWSLPYAQRYIHHAHPEVYDQLRKSGFSSVHQLRVVVVETLFCQYVVRNLGIQSEKRSEIGTLLQVQSYLYTV